MRRVRVHNMHRDTARAPRGRRGKVTGTFEFVVVEVGRLMMVWGLNRLGADETYSTMFTDQIKKVLYDKP